MDVVAMLVEKVKDLEECNWLPIGDGTAQVVATAPSGSSYPPNLYSTVLLTATEMLYRYFKDRHPPSLRSDPDVYFQTMNPYRELVKASWQEGRNMRSTRLLAILDFELEFSMPYYLPQVAERDQFQYARSAAYQLGTVNDWPELRPPQPITQRRRAPTGLNADPNFAAKIAQIQIQQSRDQNRINNR
jgi:hypothetical protein